jgi:hypothetical protein
VHIRVSEYSEGDIPELLNTLKGYCKGCIERAQGVHENSVLSSMEKFPRGHTEKNIRRSNAIMHRERKECASELLRVQVSVGESMQGMKKCEVPTHY